MAEHAAICGYCGAPLRELVAGACPFCRTPVVADVAAQIPSGGHGVVLHPSGKKKINVIKAVRARTKLDLLGAKTLVESADSGPAVIATGLALADAQAYAQEIMLAGGRADVT